MATTKQDYEALARIFKAMHGRALTTREHSLLANLTIQVASHFARNALFQKARFLEASGATEHM